MLRGLETNVISSGGSGTGRGMWGNRVREVLKEAGCLEKSPGWKRLCWTWCVEWAPGLGGAGLGGG